MGTGQAFEPQSGETLVGQHPFFCGDTLKVPDTITLLLSASLLGW